MDFIQPSARRIFQSIGMYVQLGGVQSLLRTKPIDILLERICACLHQHVDNCLRVAVVKSGLIAVAKMQC